MLVRVATTRLGKYITRDANLLRTFGWEQLVRDRRGKGDLTTMKAVNHPAKPLLQRLQKHGAPVVLQTEPWDPVKLDRAVARGPHRSCAEHHEFLEAEFADMIEKGHWIVLPYSATRKMKGLRVSPPGVVPQHGRRPRLIADLTWADVNRDTVKLAPNEAMQFGRALQRIISTIVRANPIHGPVHLMKVDLSDGFYRVALNARDSCKLALVLPPLANYTEPLVALPITLPMGWVESPPWFSAVTETGADLANQRLLRPVHNVPTHRLEAICNTPPSPTATTPPTTTPSTATKLPSTIDPELAKIQRITRLLQRFDIYVDDYVGIAQGNALHRSKVRQVLLHVIDSLFRPLSPDDHPSRKEPVSVKKAMQGDAYWETRKVVLGWLIDTVQLTLELPERRRKRLHEILASIPLHQRRTSVRKWHKILGELRSMAIALPGARGMFSQLQLALQRAPAHRVRLDRGVHDAIQDFRWLAANLTDRPTRLPELTELPPTANGACDAAGAGMGGVMFDLRKPAHPVLWRHPFPRQLQNRLVSFSNPHGDITNSDLELAATIIQHEGYVHLTDVRERTVHTASDNTPAVSWQAKGSVTTSSAPAYLMRLQALHQRHHRYFPTVTHLAGALNKMADDCSRLWTLTNTELLTHFNSQYPQNLPWRMWHPTPEMLSAVTSALRRRRSRPASILVEPARAVATGPTGSNTVENLASIRCYRQKLMASMSSRSSKYMPSGTEQANSPPAAGPYELAQSKMPSVQLHKRWPQWGPRIRG